MSEVADKIKQIVVEHLGVEEARSPRKPPSSTIWAPTVSTRSSW